MRKIVLITILAVFLVSFACQAQDTLFRLISVKGLVTLDSDTLKSGITVTNLNRSLQVKGKFDYTTILTEKGYAFQLGRGKYTVKEISRAEYTNMNNNKPPGSPYAGDFSPVRLVKIPHGNVFIFGDSLTVLARPYEKQAKQYRLVITNMLEEKLYDSASISHIYTIDITKLPGENSGLIFGVEIDSKSSSRSYYVKILPSKDRAAFNYDLDYVKPMDFVSRQLAILALCEIHALYFDQLHQLYKLWKYSQNNGTKITNAYYQRLFKEYDLEKFLPVPLTGY